MTDKHSINKKRIIKINEYRPDTPQKPVSTPQPPAQLSREEIRQAIVIRSQMGHSFQKIASELGISYVEVARIAGGLS